MGQNFVSIQAVRTAPQAGHRRHLATVEQPDLGTIMQKLQDVTTGIEGLTKSFSPDSFSTLLGPIMDFVRQNSPLLTATIGNMKTISDTVASGRGAVGD